MTKREYSGWGNTMHPFGAIASELLRIERLRKEGLTERADELHRQAVARWGAEEVSASQEGLVLGGYVESKQS